MDRLRFAAQSTAQLETAHMTSPSSVFHRSGLTCTHLQFDLHPYDSLLAPLSFDFWTLPLQQATTTSRKTVTFLSAKKNNSLACQVATGTRIAPKNRRSHPRFWREKKNSYLLDCLSAQQPQSSRRSHSGLRSSNPTFYFIRVHGQPLLLHRSRPTVPPGTVIGTTSVSPGKDENTNMPHDVPGRKDEDQQGSKLLYRPSQSTIDSSPTFRFLKFVNERHHANLITYDQLWSWSIDHLALFWDAVWDFTGVIGQKGQGKCVDEDATPADNPLWFPNARLNWAENMLKDRSDNVALIQVVEPYLATTTNNSTSTTAGTNEATSSSSWITPPDRTITYAQLYEAVVRAAESLRALGVKPGDRVGSYATNCIENVIGSLAAAALGAIWTSAASDFGPSGVLERFEQVKPKVVFVVDWVSYNGKLHWHLGKVEELIKALRAKDEQLDLVLVIIPFEQGHGQAGEERGVKGIEGCKTLGWDAFLALGHQSTTAPTRPFEFYQTSFNHPLWILFSSGTTGKPKPIVHRAGGMLLQSLKELYICGDWKEGEVVFYYTTTGWMMWNFLVGALGRGCSLVLFDGSPLREPGILWDMVERLGISVFGTSAKYLEVLAKKKYQPNRRHNLSSLRQIYSTGSPLPPHSFDYVYESISPYPNDGPTHPNQIVLSSITGGTDICSLFAGVNVALPVYRGEIQCRMLGMAIYAFEEATEAASTAANPMIPKGRPVGAGVQGELVCTKPFPCQPVGFWPLEGFGPREEVENAQKRYKAAYFEGFEGVWHHGDHVVVTESREGNGGGVVMLGRSDGVLNPGGIRFGSAEIYEVLEACFSEMNTHDASGSPSELTILDSLCVGQKISESDERVILFVRLGDGIALSDTLVKKIAAEIRSRRSARHVPALCLQVQDIPYTLNGKKVEVPVRKIINGAPISSINLATLRNPECLEEYVEIAQRIRVGGADAASRL